MKKIEVFDPALCCSTGVCGPEVDTALVGFAADVDSLKRSGGNIVRRNLAQDPLAFAENPLVKGLLARSGQSALPVILVEDEIALAGRYPTRSELFLFAGLTESSDPVSKQGASKGCCDDSGCC
ncbi:arsenite efflux transporter metallochaperone ArsD [Leptospirillum ferrooxidans]|jgi:hypothetical protein|uniref:Putative arsenical resistance operon transacting repressor n=1 Tax=Leptospirillum ferrooxidans (strain C2-3) TaxID=1162668 RepID=I0IKM1_LEPFC|nr:arsenite efflux transporter metallochaperone ArsD [Leptospirillum ferrooxidans]BAM05820.1 putative arsenical resistance operon transacting repressor [Leptospirillum ferrooxidans C2-3]